MEATIVVERMLCTSCKNAKVCRVMKDLVRFTNQTGLTVIVKNCDKHKEGV